MNASQAARQILAEVGHPLPSRAIASAALERQFVRSWSRTPTHSIAQTIEKNIRDGRDKELKFVKGERGRLIALAPWEVSSNGSSLRSAEVRLCLPEWLHSRLQLAAQARLEPDYDRTVVRILSAGLSKLKPEIEQRIKEQLATLDHSV